MRSRLAQGSQEEEEVREEQACVYARMHACMFVHVDVTPMWHA